MKPLTIIDPGTGRHFLIRGSARDFLRANEIPALHSHRERGWYVRRDRLADLLARASAQGISTRVIGGEVR